LPATPSMVTPFDFAWCFGQPDDLCQQVLETVCGNCRSSLTRGVVRGAVQRCERRKYSCRITHATTRTICFALRKERDAQQQRCGRCLLSTFVKSPKQHANT